MTNRTICPDCDGDLRPRATKCKCGWQEPEAVKQAAASARDPRLCTEYVDGVMCERLGVYGTTKRLCDLHAPFGSKGGPRIGPPGGFESLRDILARATPKQRAAVYDAVPFCAEDEDERRAIRGEP